MDTLLQDLRFAVRGLLKAPAFSATAVITLALGIGANAAMFGIVDTLLLRPPAGVARAGALVRVYWANTWKVFGPVVQASGSYPAYTLIRERAKSLEGVAAEWPRDVWIGRGDDARQVQLELVSGSYAPLLGVRAALGRWFTPAEDVAGGPAVAVISDAEWRTRYHGDPAVLDRTLQVGSKVYRIIGVAPPHFTGAASEPAQLWLPIAVAGPDLLTSGILTEGGWRWLHVLGRVAPGTTQATAGAELSTLYRAAEASSGDDVDSTSHVVLGPIQEARGPDTGREGSLPILLFGMALIVLLVAAANVANLLLARAAARRREIAVRLAMGARRTRLLRQLVTESLVLACLGGGAALLIAAWVAPVVRRLLMPAGVAALGAVDGRVLAFTAALSLLTGIATGIVPGLRAGRTDLVTDLRNGGRGATGGSRLRAGLLVTQAALALILAAGAGLFVRSLRNVLGIDIGSEARRLIAVDINLPNDFTPTAADDAAFNRVLERLRVLPGVRSAAMSVGGPFGWSFGTRITVPGLDSIPTLKSGGPYYNAVTAGFFATMGTTILRGREFTSADVATSERVAVVGATMARMLWPGVNPIGRCIQIVGGPCRTIVGIAADVHRNNVIEEPQLQWYVPLVQMSTVPRHRVAWVRVSGDAAPLMAPARRAAEAEVGPLARSIGVRSIEDVMEEQLRPWRLAATAFALFGVLALVLAAIGLYGVLAYLVTQQTRDIGVRIALGAEVADVVRLIVRATAGMIVPGLILGGAGALLLGRVVRSLLYGVAPADPAVLGAAASVLLAAALLASLLPAWRAASVDPLVALRDE